MEHCRVTLPTAMKSGLKVGCCVGERCRCEVTLPTAMKSGLKVNSTDNNLEIRTSYTPYRDEKRTESKMRPL